MENIFQKKIEDITSLDIMNLISIKYKERQGIEYKRQMYGTSDHEKKEMLRDINSIANAYGGYLIIGIETDTDGIPIKPINIEDSETKRNRIEQSCLCNIEPRIKDLRARTVSLDSGENIIIIVIPRSIKKPHMITFQDINEFWIRHNDKKILMSVAEIKDSCINAANIWKDVRQAYYDRDRELLEEIGSESFLVMGSWPLFVEGDLFNINEKDIHKFLMSPPNCTSTPETLSFHMIGIEDVLPEATLKGLRISYPKYINIQLDRNGYYEARIPVDLFTYPYKSSNAVAYAKITSYIVNYFRAVKSLTEILGIDQTLIAYMSIYNVKGLILEGGKKVLNMGNEYIKQEAISWEKNELKIPPRQIFSLDNPDMEAKIFADRFWNAFGFNEAPYFKEGVFNPNKK